MITNMDKLPLANSQTVSGPAIPVPDRVKLPKWLDHILTVLSVAILHQVMMWPILILCGMRGFALDPSPDH
jgi:hypothetical protein